VAAISFAGAATTLIILSETTSSLTAFDEPVKIGSVKTIIPSFV